MFVRTKLQSNSKVELATGSRQRSIGDDSPLPVNMRKLREGFRIITGFNDVYGNLYDEIGFGKAIKHCPLPYI